MKAAYAVTGVFSKLGGVQCDTDLPNKKVARTLSTVWALPESLGKVGKAISYRSPEGQGPGSAA